ncbi:hypothetical protein [Azotobacter beijerinckii]|uniref:hypothetical protein n=1 Tax=Azotobacter beijerinckii TaxID=170623 RepID=UPI002953F38E|nr:hypothetical protein [Azotobacter beijerinckii]MDV7210147.1 hypothetical protein [Azotobacter beijerinckii]
MYYYYWFIIKPSPSVNLYALTDFLNPLFLNIEHLSDNSFSLLFSSDAGPNSIQQWKKSFPWHRFCWINEGMFYPANLGYTQTLDGLNRFVSTYSLTYAHSKLSPLEE